MSDEKKASPGSSEVKEKKAPRFDIKGTFANYKAEYKKILWPKKDQLIKMTITVFITCAIFGVVICGLDWVFKFGYDAFTKLF